MVTAAICIAVVLVCGPGRVAYTRAAVGRGWRT